MDEGELEAAFDRGMEDAVHIWIGGSPNCPFPKGTELAKAWRRGLNEGHWSNQ